MKVELVTNTLKENNIYLRKEIEDLYQTIRKIDLQFNDNKIVAAKLLDVIDNIISNTKILRKQYIYLII